MNEKTLYLFKLNDKPLRLNKTMEGVYRVLLDKFEICNTLDWQEAEYLYDLTKYGYKIYESFGKEKIGENL